MKKLIIILIHVLGTFLVQAQSLSFQTKFEDVIPVLNVGTFHMGFTSDANRTVFNPKDPERVKEVHELAKRFAKFKPTVLVLEQVPAEQESVQARYDAYLQNPNMKFEHPSEIELLAFEVGRLSGVKKVYCVDYSEGYLYNIFNTMSHKVDSVTYPRYFQLIEKAHTSYQQALGRESSVLEKFQMNNSQLYLDFLMNINADMLLYASSPAGNEGAEQAAKFYHRNLMMFSNINKVPLNANDRMFVLMGATHTAFFRQWFDRSPKYKLENTLDYLK